MGGLGSMGMMGGMPGMMRPGMPMAGGMMGMPGGMAGLGAIPRMMPSPTINTSSPFTP